MKILVTVKRVIDYNVQVRVKADNSGVEKEKKGLPNDALGIHKSHQNVL